MSALPRLIANFNVFFFFFISSVPAINLDNAGTYYYRYANHADSAVAENY